MADHPKEKRRTQRRKKVVDYRRRCFERRGKIFFYQRRIHLGDTQMMGGTVYFSKYWDFLGEAREEFLAFLMKENLPELFTSGILLITAKVSVEYVSPLFVYDDVNYFGSLGPK